MRLLLIFVSCVILLFLLTGCGQTAAVPEEGRTVKAHPAPEHTAASSIERQADSPSRQFVSALKSSPGLLKAGGKAGEEWSANGLKMKFCWCPPGSFRMGSPSHERGYDLAQDQVDVTLTKGFWLGKYEVTQGEWQRLIGTTIVEQSKKGVDSSLSGEGEAYPMYYTIDEDAIPFCEKLTQQERAAGRLPGDWEFRLPTEAQWEYACRAGTSTATAFGDSLRSKQANFNGSEPYFGSPGESGENIGHSVPVGSYAANDWGLCDMHGNVAEVCRDWFLLPLPGGTDPERTTREEGCGRIERGGCWFSKGHECRSAFRRNEFDSGRSSGTGFRVAIVQLTK